MRKIIIIFVCLLVAGCTTTSRYTSGVDFDAEKRYQIVKKVSTKEDVKKLYGEPLDKGIDENYHEQWIYVYSVGESEFNIWTSDSRGENRVKKLIVIFDENDVVMNHVYSDSTVPSEASF